jgi:signal transduction histidine kinase
LLSAVYPTQQRLPDGRRVYLHFARDITDRKRLDEQLQRNHERDQAVNELLRLSLTTHSLEELLGRALDLLVAIPWLSLESRGAVFLVEDQPEVLVMKAERGLDPSTKESCAQVLFGRCHCGMAAATRAVQFSERLDEHHEIWHEGMAPHGHYCVPIVSGEELLGVINLYLREDHPRSAVELEFLGAVANALAGVVKRRRAEAALRESEGRLRQAQKLDAIGRLAGGIVHDFNSVLTAILGHCELLSRRERNRDRDQASLAAIQGAAQKGAALTKQLLAFSRKESRQSRPLDLNEVVGGMETLLRQMIRGPISIVVRLAPDLGPTLGDRVQVDQVILNLALNARDAMPSGGTLLLETAEVDVDYAHAARYLDARPGRYARLAVSDTGVGMDEETKSHLFEPFFTTKPEGDGTGLGLFTVYGIVKQSEGFLAVTSERGRGSRFEVYLPRL